MSRFSFALQLSGYTGVSASFVVQLYIALLRDPILFGGAQSIPGWMGRITTILFVGSLAVLFYGSALDDIFKGWVDLVTLCAVGGQWVTPLGIYLSARIGVGSSVGLLIIIGYGLHTLTAAVVTITHFRRGM